MSKKGKKKKLVKFEYDRSPDYREHYVTGARGGIQNGYHVHLEFYREKRKLSAVQHLVSDEAETERRIEDVKTLGTPVVLREFVVGIDLSFHAARELTDFLVRRTKELEGIEDELIKARENVGSGEPD